MNLPRVLLTGPNRALGDFARAAEAAGWQALREPLLETSPLPFELGPVLPDWLVLTSAAALPALADHARALAGVPTACVGQRSAEGLAALGLAPKLGPAPNAAALLAELLPRLAPGKRVLWPRGQRSRSLAAALERAEIAVDAPLSYRSLARPRAGPLPAAEAVLLASPSCVELWCASRPQGPVPWALGLGPSSAAAAGARQEAFRSPILMLDSPTPAALAERLETLRP